MRIHFCAERFLSLLSCVQFVSHGHREPLTVTYRLSRELYSLRDEAKLTVYFSRSRLSTCALWLVEEEGSS